MSTVSGLLVKVDGSIDLVQVDNGDLAPVRDLVGGWVETTFGDTWVAMFDEEGMLKGLTPNLSVFALMVALGAPRGYVGDVVFFGVKGDQTTNVPVHLIEKAKEIGLLEATRFLDYTGTSS